MWSFLQDENINKEFTTFSAANTFTARTAPTFIIIRTHWIAAARWTNAATCLSNNAEFCH